MNNPIVQCFVRGKPSGAGSKTAIRLKTGVTIVKDSCPTTKSWQVLVKFALANAMQGNPMVNCPVKVSLDFVLPRPKNHYGRKGGVAYLKQDAPVRATSRGRDDLDKFIRAVLDAMTNVVFFDDGQVWFIASSKVYGETPGVAIMVES